MAYRTIILKNGEYCPQEEAVMHEAAYPGHFVEFNADLEFAKAAESGAKTSLMILIEDDLQGKKISEAYDSASQARARWVQPGTEVYAWLAKGHSVTQGDRLELAGFEEAGCVGAAEFHSSAKGTGVIAVAKETVDNSAGTSGARIKIQII